MHKEYFKSGELKSKGKYIELIDCTSRGSGQSILIDDHKGCPECILGSCKRKIGMWKYYYKTGQLKMEGHYLVLDSIGVPSLRNGLWNTKNNNGQLFQQIVYEKGEVQELVCFDDEGNKID